jgi:ATP-dependent Lhr-like helicase
MKKVDYSHLEWAHPLVRDWFVSRFGSATEPQELGWPHILGGSTTLIAAPTGSGKTLAAFLACIDKLVRKALDGSLMIGVAVVYVSPLKALSNDVQKNLEIPLKEIAALAAERGLSMAEIRTAVRTGDTLASERAAMLRKPPHILVTTPESLYILLTAQKSRAILGGVDTVIVDEIHAMADDKRGAHLCLSLERLDHLVGKKVTRIGLSATQKPIEITAKFLAGSVNKLPVIVDVGHRRKLDVTVEVPESPLGPIISNQIWDDVYKRLGTLINEHRSTLVFVNTRKHVERVAMHLTSVLGSDAVAAHHGSLSRKIRLEAERKLKNGEIKVLVATASLELGIDIGFVDLVCQIGSPRAIATALQRIGRAGHWRGATPKGRLFAMTRDELVELAALNWAIAQGDLDRLMVPPAPLDILAQQIVAACAVEEWQEDELFELVKRAYPYASIERKDFDRVVSMLSDGISAGRGRYGAYLMRDQVNGKLRGRRGARLVAMTNGGAIPESNTFSVVLHPEGTVIGTLDEDFAVESNGGDIILLGNSSWRIRRVESRQGRVLVEDAHGLPPTVPFWLGEGPSRTAELSDYVSELRGKIDALTQGLEPGLQLAKDERVSKAVTWLESQCRVTTAAAEQIVEYVVEGRAVLGCVPGKKRIVAERFFDEGGGMQLIIHAPFGGRVNKAWGLALRKKFCRSFNFELQAAATDNGLNIALAEQHSFPLSDVFFYLSQANIDETLEQAALVSPIFKTRWRWDSTRSLALLRFVSGKKVPPYLQRMRSDDLLAAVFPAAAACQDNIDGDIPLPDHPLIEEVMKDVLFEAMDLHGLKEILSGIADGSITCVAADTTMPSAFSHEILNANPYAYLDDAPLEERRSRAVEMRRTLPANVVAEVGRLDEQAIKQVGDEVWPDLRDAHELHDFLLTVVALPEDLSQLPQKAPEKIWEAFFAELIKTGRASRAIVENRSYWVPAERAQVFKSIFSEAAFEKLLPKVGQEEMATHDAIEKMVQGWLMVTGPVNSEALRDLLGLPSSEIEVALLRLEAKGNILRGSFTGRSFCSGAKGQALTEWCDRRLLARIHSLTIGALRRQIEPVTAQVFMRWLANWQHVAPGSQLIGEHGTLEVIRQLQGFEIAANAWEGQILSSRIVDYDPAVLDKLCLTGAIGWGRLSPHPAILENGRASDSNNENGAANSQARRIVPTSVAPITFFVREDADWLKPRQHNVSQEDLALSSNARLIRQFLTRRGASFFADVVRETNLLKAEVEAGLWELVAAGLVTADGFDNIRALIDPHRRAGLRGTRHLRPRHSTGRWSLLYTDCDVNRQKMIEATGKMLLHRYGVVFREVLTREADLPSWRELLHCFRLMEDKGEVRGGRFVTGFAGEQFALPAALESLRAMRNREPLKTEVVLSAADPLNLLGVILPGEKIPAVSGKVIRLSV